MRWVGSASPKRGELEKALVQLRVPKVTGADFVAEAQKAGLSAEEARQELAAMHQEGKVFHFEEGGVDYVFLDTAIITRTLSELLDPSGKTVKTMVRQKEAELTALSSEMEEMEALKRVIEKKTDQSVRRIMWGIIAYFFTQTV